MPKAIKQTPTTGLFNFLYGSFVLSNWPIPYLTTTMTISDAAQFLNVASELPGADKIEWDLEELYQRDIDWPRVQNQIEPWLNSTERPQFFNSLTIAILPYDREHSRLKPSYDDETDWNAPEFPPERYKQELVIGPIRMGFWEEWTSYEDPEFVSGQFQWNPKETFAVAIDGQHRLASLKILKENKANSAVLDDTRVPVIFLIFDSRIGYVGPPHSTTVQILRQLFIDLNKHAKTVSRARQILLDDWDPHAICVRELIGQRLSSTLADLDLDPRRLPLSLVDWYSEQAKFDEGPCLTTVLGIDWMVTQVLGTKPIGDYTDYVAIGRQIKLVEKSLGLDLTVTLARLEENEGIQVAPFSYTSDELEAIGTTFGLVWSDALVCLLTEFNPYRAMIGRRESDDSLCLEFQNWYRLYKRALADSEGGKAKTEYQSYMANLKHDPIAPKGEPMMKELLGNIESLKEKNLSFNVVFQRALVKALLEYCKVDGSVIESFTDDDDDVGFPEVDFDEIDDDVDEIVEEELEGFGDTQTMSSESVDLKERNVSRAMEFVDALNRLVDGFESFLEIDAKIDVEDGQSAYFWQGTLRKPDDGSIDFTQAATNRAADLILAVVMMIRYDDLTEADVTSDFDVYWDEIQEYDAPLFSRKAFAPVRRYSQGETSSAGRILAAAGILYEDDLGFEECLFRLRHVWLRMGL